MLERDKAVLSDTHHFDGSHCEYRVSISIGFCFSASPEDLLRPLKSLAFETTEKTQSNLQLACPYVLFLIPLLCELMNSVYTLLVNSKITNIQ